MVRSKHSVVRAKQRGIPKDTLEFILHHGFPERKPGNALEYKLLKKEKTRILWELKQQIKLVEKSAGKAVLVGDDGTVITVYHLF
jgi:hypothetical protein